MLNKVLVAGYSNTGPKMLVMQVEWDQQLKPNDHKQLVERAARHHGISGSMVIFDVEEDCTSIPFLDLKSERTWTNAPIFLESMA